MKKLLFVLTAIIFCFGCEKELPKASDGGDLVKVGLSLSGEVSVSEEPLSRAGESNALLGIQVWQGGEKYAWGLFDTTEGINIYLHTGQEYAITCQYIKNGKEALYNFDKAVDATRSTYILSDIRGEYYDKVTSGPKVARYDEVWYNFHKYTSGYGLPFDILDSYKFDGCWCTYYEQVKDYYGISGNYVIRYKPNNQTKIEVCRTICDITNKFVYDKSGRMNVNDPNVARNSSYNGDIDRYYVKEHRFTAESGSDNHISLEMKHLVYGVQCNVTGVTDGTATITIKNGENTLLNKTDISGEWHSGDRMFAFSNMRSAYEYADNYTENVTVSMTWLRGVGVMQDLGSQVVQVKRNCMNVINVSLSASKAGAALGVEAESVEMAGIDVNCSTHY